MFKCACQDQPVAIATVRQQETFIQGSYWCSGILVLISPSGGSLYVWNPFSLAELKTKLGDFDAYLNCVASKNDNTCVAPSDPIFDKQQVMIFRCCAFCIV